MQDIELLSVKCKIPTLKVYCWLIFYLSKYSTMPFSFLKPTIIFKENEKHIIYEM